MREALSPTAQTQLHASRISIHTTAKLLY